MFEKKLTDSERIAVNRAYTELKFCKQQSEKAVNNGLKKIYESRVETLKDLLAIISRTSK